jgi:hypothetical protein
MRMEKNKIKKMPVKAITNFFPTEEVNMFLELI